MTYLTPSQTRLKNGSADLLAPSQPQLTLHQQAALGIQMARARLRQLKAMRTLTCEAVTLFAALHIVDDDGIPISPAPHHMLWVRLLCDERIKKLLIIAPPESAKTTWVLSAYVGCYISFYPERNVIIGSVSGSVAEKRSVSVRGMIESAAWRGAFPDIQQAQGMAWTTTEWSIAPDGKPFAGRLHPTISAYGTGGSVIGGRADLIVPDDLLDFDNTRTAHQRNLVAQWFQNSLLSRLKSKTGRLAMVGTTWHHDDLIARVRKEPGWVVCHTPLLGEGADFYANLFYPDDWKYEKLGEPVAQAGVFS